MDGNQGKLFFRGLPQEITEEALRDHFSVYGRVLETVIRRDKLTGRPRGTGYLVFADLTLLDRVMVGKHNINGCTEVRISRAPRLKPFSFTTERRAAAQAHADKSARTEEVRASRAPNNTGLKRFSFATERRATAHAHAHADKSARTAEAQVSRAPNNTSLMPFSFATERRAAAYADKSARKKNSQELPFFKGRSVVLGKAGIRKNVSGEKENEANHVTEKEITSFSPLLSGAVSSSISSSPEGIATAHPIVDEPISLQEDTNKVCNVLDVISSGLCSIGEYVGVISSSNIVQLIEEAVDSSLACVANGPTEISVQKFSIQVSGDADVTPSEEILVGEIKGVVSTNDISVPISRLNKCSENLESFEIPRVTLTAQNHEDSKELAGFCGGSAVPGQGRKSDQGGYSSQFISDDTGGRKNITVAKGKEVNYVTEEGTASFSQLPMLSTANKVSSSQDGIPLSSVVGVTLSEENFVHETKEQAISPEKFHNRKSLIWVPVRLSNTRKSSGEGSRSNTFEANHVSYENYEHDVKNDMQTKRTQRLIYVPKPAVKELDQQEDSQKLHPSLDLQFGAQSSGGGRAERLMLANSELKNDGVHRTRQRGKMHSIWRKRDNTQLPSDPVEHMREHSHQNQLIVGLQKKQSPNDDCYSENDLSNQFSHTISSALQWHACSNLSFTTGQEISYTGSDLGFNDVKQININEVEQNHSRFQYQEVGSHRKSKDYFQRNAMISKKAQKSPEQNAKMKGVALRCAKELQHEEERQRKQKERALAKVEELDRRISAHSSEQENRGNRSQYETRNSVQSSEQENRGNHRQYETRISEQRGNHSQYETRISEQRGNHSQYETRISAECSEQENRGNRSQYATRPRCEWRIKANRYEDANYVSG